MRKIKILAGLIMMLSILASCGKSDKVISGNLIQKRKYNKGFFVSRNQKVKKEVIATNFEAEANRVAVTEKTFNAKIKVEYTDEIEEVDNELVASNNESSLSREEILKSSKTKEYNVREKIKPAKLIVDDEEEEVVETKIEKVGMIGFFIGLASGMAQTAYILIPVFGVAALTMGIISLIKINKDPTKYRKKGMTYFSIILGILAIAMFFLLVALV